MAEHRPASERGKDYHEHGDHPKLWIAGATKHKGALHRALGVPQGEKIPAKKLAKAAHSKSPKVRKEVALAKTLKGLRK